MHSIALTVNNNFIILVQSLFINHRIKLKLIPFILQFIKIENAYQALNAIKFFFYLTYIVHELNME